METHTSVPQIRRSENLHGFEKIVTANFWGLVPNILNILTKAFIIYKTPDKWYIIIYHMQNI